MPPQIRFVSRHPSSQSKTVKGAGGNEQGKKSGRSQLGSGWWLTVMNPRLVRGRRMAILHLHPPAIAFTVTCTNSEQVTHSQAAYASGFAVERTRCQHPD